MKEKYTYIELFAGAGGFFEGFRRAGFHQVALVEMDKNTAFTLKTRLGYYYLKETNRSSIYFDYIKGNIQRDEYYDHIPQIILSSVINEEIREDNIEYISRRIKKQMLKQGIKKIDVMAGGPPCQAYSLVGRARDTYGMNNDRRNYLYRLYVKILKKFSPEMFIFENVPGLISAGNGRLWKDIRSYFLASGYEIDFRLLNSYDFGVLQKRKRIILMGWKKGYDLNFPDFKKDKNVEKYRIIDLFYDLSFPAYREKLYTGNYTSDTSGYLSEYGIRTHEDKLTLHVTRYINERDRKIYKFYIDAWFKEKRRPAYDELPEYLKTHKNRKIFKDRFKIIAPDLPYLHTIVAHLEKDGHYFIHYDINQLRSISVREAARVQSFPDSYYFEGAMGSMFRQIGNAVPPLMAEKMAYEIKKMLEAI